MTTFEVNATTDKVRAVMTVFDENHDTNVETKMEKTVRETHVASSVRTTFEADRSDPEQEQFVQHMFANFQTREVK